VTGRTALARPGAVRPAISDAPLRSLPSVPLDVVQGAALLDRIDTKFVVTPAYLPTLLAQTREGYAVLEIGGERSFAYTTTYFDTLDRRCFLDHVRGRPVRVKVRLRRYHATATTWLELKRRQANGRTRKVRLLLPEGSGTLPDPHMWPPEFHDALPTHLEATAFRPVVDVHYQRSTLLYRAPGVPPERVTIDQALVWMRPLVDPSPDATPDATAHASALARAQLPLAEAHCVIVELKQGVRHESPVRKALRQAGIRSTAVSKYCLGVAALDPPAAPAPLRAQLHALRRPD